MASGYSIQLIGFDEMKLRLAALPARVERACFRRALRSTAKKAKDRIKAATRRLTGAAQRAVKVKVRVRGSQAYAVVKYKERPSFYIRLLDRGAPKHGQPARPFFAATVAGMEQQVEDDFVTALALALSTAEIAEAPLPT